MKKKLKQAKAVAKAQVARSNAIGTPTRTVVNFTLPLSSKAKDAAFRPEKSQIHALKRVSHAIQHQAILIPPRERTTLTLKVKSEKHNGRRGKTRDSEQRTPQRRMNQK